jgi:hypothetical protein
MSGDRDTEQGPRLNTRAHRNGRSPEAQVSSDKRLVEEIRAFIRRYMVLSESQSLIVALWIIHTHLIEHVDQTPYLSITSPDTECGKSRLMEVLEVLVARAWLVINPSEAVAFRQIDAMVPTLLLDEVDTIFSPQSARFHEGLRAIIDAGHRRGTMVPRATDFGRGVEHFSPFCAKALAGIGTLPDTISRRSIYIRLGRKKKDEQVEKFKRRDVLPVANALRDQVAAWAAARGEAVGQSRPDMPHELSDRMEEGCESLIAIADLMGCGTVARTAIVEVLSGERLDAQDTMRVRLLRDLRRVFQQCEKRRGKPILGLHTQTLLNELHRIEEAPWSSHYYGRDLNANDLASLLKHYNVSSRSLKIAGRVQRGYRRDALYSVFERYLADGE